LIKKVLGINLDSEGISVIPIHGAHFGAYAKLFGPTSIAKKCSIVTDGDAQNESEPPLAPEDEAAVPLDPSVPLAVPGPTRLEKLQAMSNDHMRVFVGETTFEMELTLPGNLGMFAATCEELGATRRASFLKNLDTELKDVKVLSETQLQKLARAKDYVLNASKQFSKGRFSQVASKHVDKATVLPEYIVQAVRWVAE
jgi:putative ATP-dependent endonuclease of OLD family